MRKYSFINNGFTFERVDKKTARRAYNNGLRVLFCPCNLRPGAPWFPECEIDKEISENATFETVLNSFEFYNLRNRETGYYTAFYIPVKYVNKFNGNECGKDYYHAIVQYNYDYLRRCK